MISRAQRKLRGMNPAMRIAAASGVALVLVGGVTAAGAAITATPSTVINACVLTKDGSVRIIAAGKTCVKGETAVTWNQTGPVGPVGAPGVAGAKGETGAAGVAGPKGEPGVPGPAGEVGPVGPAGAGEAGVAGEIGPKGDVGADGAPGAVGPAGAKGETGATGDVGQQGDKGATGDVGPVGPAGSGAASSYVRRTRIVTGNGLQGVAACEDDDQVVGGGFEVQEWATGDLVYSKPVQFYVAEGIIVEDQAYPVLDGWAVKAKPDFTGRYIDVFAVCMSIKVPTPATVPPEWMPYDGGEDLG